MEPIALLRRVQVADEADPVRAAKTLCGFVVLLLACVGLLGSPLSVQADARSAYLVRVLSSSPSGRVRVQAALGLGRLGNQAGVTAALSEALNDDEPSVRAAAATALGRLRDGAALVALRSVEQDEVSEVRAAARRAVAAIHQGRASNTASIGASSGEADEPEQDLGPARYYVGVGMPGSRVEGIPDEVLAGARATIIRELRGVSGVRLAPSSESLAETRRVLQRDELVGYFLDSSVMSLEENASGVRARVSVVLQSYPERSIRSMLQGAATVRGGRPGPATSRQAVQHAFVGALRNVESAMESSRPANLDPP